MSITPQTVRGGIPNRLRRIGWHYPEWWVVVAAAVAWVFMIVMARPHAGIILDLGSVLMVIAMMLPLTIPNVRHVALSSLWRRRHRAIVAFLVGFLAVWIAVQTVIVGAWGLLAPLIGWEIVAGVAMVAAVLWEIAPNKRRWLRRCHRTVSLAPRGWRADVDCVHYGVTTGFSCVAMCWALMAASAAFAHALLVMAVLFGVQVSGRYQRRHSPILAALTVLGVCLLSLATWFLTTSMGHEHSMH